jgi:hypothetical protein
MKIYIAGKITGENVIDCFNKFFETKLNLKIEFENSNVVTPFDIEGIYFGISHDEAMRNCLTELKTCTHAYFLKDWKDSKGAMIEHQFCLDNGIEIIYEL